MTPGAAHSDVRLPRAAKLYIAAVGAVAVASAGCGVAVHPGHYLSLADVVRPDAAFPVLAVLGFLSWWVRERDIGGRVSLSFTSVILLAAIALVGPAGAAVVGFIAPLAGLRSVPRAFTLLNCVMFSAIGSLAGWAYNVVGGPAYPQLAYASNLWRLLGALLVADIVQCLCNAVIVSGMYRVHRGRPFCRQLLGILHSTGLVYLGYGVLGLIFVIIWVPAKVGPVSAVLVLAPLLVAQWSFAQYGNEQRSHERTLNALVTALETKDRYTRGHSERVADLCELLAMQLSLTEQQSGALRYAGLLHDVGKLGLPTRLLRRPSPLSDDEVVEIAAHAAIGADMLDRIEFLGDALDGVRHHHERWDGRGYPDGLAGEAIPLFARIIAVVDAFEAMTTDRGDRPAYEGGRALEELRARAGSQFDPVVVEALAEALVRHPWSITDVSVSSDRPGEAPYDHDRPLSSDQLAARADLLLRIHLEARELQELQSSQDPLPAGAVP